MIKVFDESFTINSFVYIICSSDALTHAAEMSEELRLQSLQNLTDLLSHTFTSQFVFPALGHEDVSLNFAQTSRMWKHWLPNEALQTFDKCLYNIITTESLIFLNYLLTFFFKNFYTQVLCIQNF